MKRKELKQMIPQGDLKGLGRPEASGQMKKDEMVKGRTRQKPKGRRGPKGRKLTRADRAKSQHQCELEGEC